MVRFHKNNQHQCHPSALPCPLFRFFDMTDQCNCSISERPCSSGAQGALTATVASLIQRRLKRTAPTVELPHGLLQHGVFSLKQHRLAFFSSVQSPSRGPWDASCHRESKVKQRSDKASTVRLTAVTKRALDPNGCEHWLQHRSSVEEQQTVAYPKCFGLKTVIKYWA